MLKEIRQYVEAPVIGDGNTLVGYAAVFNSPSQPLIEGGKRFIEIIKPGAFRSALLGNRDIKALYAHDRKEMLGRTKSGTLKLTEDDKGLRYELTLAKTTRGNDVREMVARGDISGASFGFSVPTGGDKWTKTDGGFLREVSLVDLAEISLVDDPAYQDTSVALRFLEQFDRQLVEQVASALRLKRQELAEWY